jgi:hypothetical protein
LALGGAKQATGLFERVQGVGNHRSD